MKRLLTILAFLWSIQLYGQDIEVADYQRLSVKTADYYIEKLDSFKSLWRERAAERDQSRFQPAANDIYLACLFVNLYELRGEQRYLKAATSLLLEYDDYRLKLASRADERPEYANGIPSITSFFLLPKYARAYELVVEHGKLRKKEKKQLDSMLANAADFQLLNQEWGPMNRAMLRAEGLLYAAKLLPNHPNSRKWQQMGDALLTDNLENWSIEDAGMYNMIWLYSLCGYAHFVARDDQLLKSPFLHYYFDYFTAIQDPSGLIPDYGDAKYRSWWQASIPVFEAAGSAYQNGHYRWAAAFAMSSQFPEQSTNLTLALRLSEAALWADSEVIPKTPFARSQQILDDLAGKKFVFRNGRSKGSTYLLLNYKDEGAGGWLYRENLRRTLSVQHEKMHHGHADENAIITYLHKGATLLRDGGYRPELPSGPKGEYRGDIYHNRLIFRNSTALPDSGKVYKQLSNKGYYSGGTTKKIDFIRTQNADYSRSEFTTADNHHSHQRTLIYLKSLEMFMVVDILRSSKDSPSLVSQLWHSQEVVEQGGNYFRTRYTSIGNYELKGAHDLVIYYPSAESIGLSSIDSLRRHRQKELMISNSHLLGKGLQEKVLISFLIPVKREGETELPNISIYSDGNAIGATIAVQGEEIFCGLKLDLNKGLQRSFPRPMYKWESDSYNFNGLLTDADFFLLNLKDRKLEFSAVNCTKLIRKDEVLFEQGAVSNEYRDDGGPLTAAPWKVRLAEGLLKME